MQPSIRTLFIVILILFGLSIAGMGVTAIVAINQGHIETRVQKLEKVINHTIVKNYHIKSGNGRNGSAGKNGRDGRSGHNGKNGVAGAQGIRGSQGARGSAGVNGSRGSQGAQGSQGTRGATGNSGPPGPQGPPGPPGAQGPPGRNGVTTIITKTITIPVPCIHPVTC